MNSPRQRLVTIIQIWLPILTVVGGGVWALYKYTNEQRVAVQQPFLSKQLELYVETSQVIGKLIILDPADDGWKSAEARYWALYWSELSLVEHDVVKAGMQNYAPVLIDYKRDPGAKKRLLEDSTYRLSRALREGVSASWSSAQK